MLTNSHHLVFILTVILTNVNFSESIRSQYCENGVCNKPSKISLDSKSIASLIPTNFTPEVTIVIVLPITRVGLVRPELVISAFNNSLKHSLANQYKQKHVELVYFEVEKDTAVKIVEYCYLLRKNYKTSPIAAIFGYLDKDMITTLQPFTVRWKVPIISVAILNKDESQLPKNNVFDLQPSIFNIASRLIDEIGLDLNDSYRGEEVNGFYSKN